MRLRIKRFSNGFGKGLDHMGFHDDLVAPHSPPLRFIYKLTVNSTSFSPTLLRDRLRLRSAGLSVPMRRAGLRLAR
jgi:hypothetical protein